MYTHAQSHFNQGPILYYDKNPMKLSIIYVYTKPNVSFKFVSLDKGCVEMRTKKVFKLSLYYNLIADVHVRMNN